MALRCQPAEPLPPVALPPHLRLWGIDSGIRHRCHCHRSPKAWLAVHAMRLHNQRGPPWHIIVPLDMKPCILVCVEPRLCCGDLTASAVGRSLGSLGLGTVPSAWDSSRVQAVQPILVEAVPSVKKSARLFFSQMRAAWAASTTAPCARPHSWACACSPARPRAWRRRAACARPQRAVRLLMSQRTPRP